MDHLEWLTDIELDNAVLIAAFTGWNDAGDAATETVSYLARRYDAEPVARIDPEFFYDFASIRPTIRLADGEHRELEWPKNEILLCDGVGARPVVLLHGIEPRLRWRSFTEAVITAANRLGVRTVITLGALLTETHHAAPIDVIGTSNDRELNERLDLRPSSYEGPTGIVGVLNDACYRAGLESISFWAAVPSYVGQSPSPKAALALVEQLAAFLDISLAATDLQIASASYERQVDEIVADDPELGEYAERLLEVSGVDDAEPLTDDPEALIDELEEFLRQQDD